MTENVMEQAADSDLEVSEGQLVWYNERKGYGFVRIGDEEVFLHRSTLDRFGLVRLLNGDHVTVSLSKTEHGRVIKDLLSVRRAVIPDPPAASEPEEGEVRAVVEFVNDLRGYGVVTTNSAEEDVFVHSRFSMTADSLAAGPEPLVKVDSSSRGLQVNSVRCCPTESPKNLRNRFAFRPRGARLPSLRQPADVRARPRTRKFPEL